VAVAVAVLLQARAALVVVAAGVLEKIMAAATGILGQ
jgi:hypothetical protein